MYLLHNITLRSFMSETDTGPIVVEVLSSKEESAETTSLLIYKPGNDDGSGAIVERVEEQEDDILSLRSKKFQDIAKYTIVLALILLFIGEFLHYIYIWSPKAGFTYPLALVASIYLIGLGLFVGSAGFQTYMTESDRKPLWWSVYAGAIFSFLQTAIVIFGADEFVAAVISGHLVITRLYIAVYVMAAVSMALLASPLILIDLYGRSLKRARFFRALIITGIVTKQSSMLITIHSFVCQTGFALFIVGSALATSGYVLGLWEAHRRRRKYRLMCDSEDNS